MQLSAKELAALLEGSIEGNPDVLVNRPGKIEEGQAGEITFLGNDKYEPFIYTTQASVVLVNKDFSPRQAIQATLIRVENVYAALAFLLDKFGAQTAARTAGEGISPQASIHPEAQIGQGVSIGPFAVVEAGASIGDGAKIGAQVFVGQGAAVGEESVLYPGVRILHDCRVGARCILHANAVVGSDGFGFAPQPDGTYKKIAQIGNVVIEDDVEIGANTTIDRSRFKTTLIKKGSKIDNLVQIGHGVTLGENNLIVSQAGVAGSSETGKDVILGGQSGVSGHIKIGDGVKIAAKTGISKSLLNPGNYGGIPAIPFDEHQRRAVYLKNIDKYVAQIKSLEKRIAAL